MVSLVVPTLGALVLCVVISGCAVGPDFSRPTAPVPAAYKEIAGWKQAEPRDHELRGEWWKMYGDPVLDQLAAEVSASNQTLAQAEARYRQARTLATQSRAAYLPVVDVSASTSRSRASASGTTTTGGSRGAVSRHELALDASWEPDLWGRVRRTVEANVASAQASAADIESVRLALQAELAQIYFLLRAVELQQQLFENTLRAFEESLKLTQNRYDSGVVARSDVVQAQTQLRSTQAQAFDLGVQRAQLEHALAVLTGRPPADFTLPRSTLVAAPPAIPVGLPSELLERRPDVATAERRVEAANAQIGVAQSAYFPSLTLTAAGGFQSSLVSNLLTTPARFWSLGAALAQTIFDAGLRRARTQQAIAVYDETVAAYRQTVLTSFQEVEDNLAALRILEEASVVQAEALALARLSLELTMNQYKAGIVSYLNVLTAQTTAFAAERTAVELRNRRLAASVLLVRALGGGWNAERLPRAAEINAADNRPEPSPSPR